MHEHIFEHKWTRDPTEDAFDCECGLRVTGHAMACIRKPEQFEPAERSRIVLGGISIRKEQAT